MLQSSSFTKTPQSNLLVIGFLLLINVPIFYSSHVSFNVGSGAASQLLHEAAHQILSIPRPVYISLRTHQQPLLFPLAHIDTYNRISYSNVTLKFYPDTVRLKANNLRVQTVSNIAPKIWPMSFGDETVHFTLLVGDIEFAARVDHRSSNVRLLSCLIRDTTMNANASVYWMAGTVLSYLTRHAQDESKVQNFLCPFISKYISGIQSPVAIELSLDDVLPLHVRELVNASQSSLHCRISSVVVEEKHVLVDAQLRWIKVGETACCMTPSNASDMNMKWDNEDRLTVWIDDSAVNHFLDQIDWNFQWMEEMIAVTSPVIPLSSREFLSTLCTSCYFLLNVWANGPPAVCATNGTIVLEKRDRINLRVVNPEKNITSVFVSMILAVTAELRPKIDSGTLRTLVQLLDTNVVMENGAFPPSWSFFVQDLVKNMIIEMMWPEMKKQIEELTYGEGIRLATSCGINPRSTEILVEEGRFGLTATLVLQNLQAHLCLKDLKSALPNAAKLFPR